LINNKLKNQFSMKNIITCFAFIFIISAANAQDKSNAIAVGIGASANYYYGQGNHNFTKFEGSRVNYKLDGMLGLTIARDHNDHRTMIAGFGSFGLNNRRTIERIFEDQGYVTSATDQSASNNFYQLEGGLLIGEMLRISTGVGEQVFDEQSIASEDGIDLQKTSLKYYSSTVGFNLNLSAVALLINCTFNYGKDYNKTIIIPSAGLMFKF